MSLENKLDKLLEMSMEQKVDIAAMKVDLSHHIKRSDAHEKQLADQQSKINKLWLVVSLLGGAGIGNAGPSILKFLGDLL